MVQGEKTLLGEFLSTKSSKQPDWLEGVVMGAPFSWELFDSRYQIPEDTLIEQLRIDYSQRFDRLPAQKLGRAASRLLRRWLANNKKHSDQLGVFKISDDYLADILNILEAVPANTSGVRSLLQISQDPTFGREDSHGRNLRRRAMYAMALGVSGIKDNEIRRQAEGTFRRAMEDPEYVVPGFQGIHCMSTPEAIELVPKLVRQCSKVNPPIIPRMPLWYLAREMDANSVLAQRFGAVVAGNRDIAGSINEVFLETDVPMELPNLWREYQRSLQASGIYP
jgi:hypothetical protein